jgi:hypothetical protein
VIGKTAALKWSLNLGSLEQVTVSVVCGTVSLAVGTFVSTITSFVWTAPGPASSSCRVKVDWNNTTTALGNAFSIK